jgi:hypothetical protein
MIGMMRTMVSLRRRLSPPMMGTSAAQARLLWEVRRRERRLTFVVGCVLILLVITAIVAVLLTV